MNYIILDYKKMQKNWELYKFLIDKKYVIDFTTFLLEFINEEDLKNYLIQNKEIINILKNISVNNELSILNRNNKMIKNLFNNNFQKEISFIISKLIEKKESEIIYKLLQNFLNATIMEEKMNDKRSKSYNKNNIKDDKKKNFNIYLIAKEVSLNKYFDINNTYKGIISPVYVYDSFLKGQLLDITNNDIYKKYKI